MPRADNRSQALAARLLSATLIVLALYFAKPVLVPLGLALLIAFMLQPAVRWLRRVGLHNSLAVGLSTLVFFALLGALGWGIGGQVQSLSEGLPKYRADLVDKVMQIRGKLRGGSIETIKSTVTDVIKDVEEKERAEAPPDETADAGAPAPGAPWPPPPRVVDEPEPTRVIVTKEDRTVDDVQAAAVLLAPLGTAGLVALLAVLILLKWADLRTRLIALIGHNLTTTTAALDDAAQRVRRYLAMQFLVNAGTGLLVWGGLSWIGLEYAGLMGLCAGLFRYIPYVGPVAAAALPLIASVAMMPGWGPFLSVAAFFLVMELVLNNVIEPVLYGSRLGVSEIGIIMAAVGWTLLWGPVGLVLATPMTVCLVVLGEKVPGLAFLSKMLSDRIQQPAHATLTQRLIAGDTLEAADALESFHEREGLEQAIDAVVVPALASLRREQRLGHLDAAATSSIASSLPAMIAELEDLRPPATTQMGKDSQLAIWSLCPMSEVAASLLPLRYQHLPCSLVQFNVQSLVSDVIARLLEAPPLGLVLLHLDPADFPRVLASLRRLRRAHPHVPVVVARWGEDGFATAEREELVSLGAAAVVATPSALAAWVAPRALSVARVLPADSSPAPAVSATKGESASKKPIA